MRRIGIEKLARQKFGSLPESIEARIRTASLAELDQVSERLLSAATSHELFGSNR